MSQGRPRVARPERRPNICHVVGVAGPSTWVAGIIIRVRVARPSTQAQFPQTCVRRRSQQADPVHQQSLLQDGEVVSLGQGMFLGPRCIAPSATSASQHGIRLRKRPRRAVDSSGMNGKEISAAQNNGLQLTRAARCAPSPSAGGQSLRAALAAEAGCCPDLA